MMSTQLELALIPHWDDQYLYKVEKPNETSTEITANIISENMLSQVD